MTQVLCAFVSPLFFFFFSSLLSLSLYVHLDIFAVSPNRLFHFSFYYLFFLGAFVVVWSGLLAMLPIIIFALVIYSCQHAESYTIKIVSVKSVGPISSASGNGRQSNKHIWRERENKRNIRI